MPSVQSHAEFEIYVAPEVSTKLAEAYVLASRLPKGLFDLIDRRFFCGPDALSQDNDVRSASGARRHTITLRLSDSFLDLLSALRALDFDGDVSDVDA